MPTKKMQKRKTQKKFSESQKSKAVLGLPETKACPRSPYLIPFERIVGGLKIYTLSEFLEEYRKELNISDWNSDVLDKFIGAKISDRIEEIIYCCSPLGPLLDLTRFLFAKFACMKARFTATGVHKIRLPPCRFMEQVDDNVLMVSFMGNFNAALDRANNEGLSIYKNNVYYVRKDGLSVFCVDRYNLIDPAAEAQFSIIYLLDALPYFFILPTSIPITAITSALQAALGFNFRATACPEKQSLNDAVIEEARRRGLRRDMFPDHLKNLLHFQANTLRPMVRESHLTKYPCQHNCSFKEVSFTLTDGLAVSLKSRNGENLLESLYQLELEEKLQLPEAFVQNIASNSRNSFTAFDLATVKKKL